MNTLLLFFALPIATIILAIVLEKILNNPILVAATFFAIYLIVAFSAFDATFLIFVIAYTILAYISAVISEFFFRRCESNDSSHSNSHNNSDNSNSNNFSCEKETVTANITNNLTGNRSSWCCYRR